MTNGEYVALASYHPIESNPQILGFIYCLDIIYYVHTKEYRRYSRSVLRNSTQLSYRYKYKNGPFFRIKNEHSYTLILTPDSADSGKCVLIIFLSSRSHCIHFEAFLFLILCSELYTSTDQFKKKNLSLYGKMNQSLVPKQIRSQASSNGRQAGCCEDLFVARLTRSTHVVSTLQ